MKSICILGRQPALGLAELESLYGHQKTRSIPGAAVLDIPAGEIDFRRLGGTIKVASVLAVVDVSSWPKIEKYLLDKVPAHLKTVPDGKFTLGLSAYGSSTDAAEINKTALRIKKAIRNDDRPVRVIPNKTLALSSAQVLHNRLTSRGAWELLLVADGQKTILAQTIFVQDIEAYGARDQARPKRDSRVGMLPPKLAQIIINLTNPPAGGTILDPFCGTGVLLQEALLMGYDAAGTDIEPRMIEYAGTNLAWLKDKYPGISGSVELEVGDATNYRWGGRVDAVATETYLGRPLSGLPPPEKLKTIISDVNTVLTKSLRNLSGQLAAGSPLCLAVPAWQIRSGQFQHLPLVAKLTDMGYNKVKFKQLKDEDLIYYRPDQIVARQLLVLRKS